MDYRTTDVPASIWGDKGVTVETAMRPNPHINDAEIISSNDTTVLKTGTYILSKSNELYKVKEDSNLLLSMIYHGRLPDVEIYGEMVENAFTPHITVLDTKQIAEELNDLDAVYLMTVESYGRNENILKKTEQVTVSAVMPPVKINIYGLTYITTDRTVQDIAHYKIEDSAQINEILKGTGISKNKEGLYQLVKRVTT